MRPQSLSSLYISPIVSGDIFFLEPSTTPGSHGLSRSSTLSLEEDLDINIPLGAECSKVFHGVFSAWYRHSCL